MSRLLGGGFDLGHHLAALRRGAGVLDTKLVFGDTYWWAAITGRQPVFDGLWPAIVGTLLLVAGACSSTPVRPSTPAERTPTPASVTRDNPGGDAVEPIDAALIERLAREHALADFGQAETQTRQRVGRIQRDGLPERGLRPRGVDLRQRGETQHVLRAAQTRLQLDGTRGRGVGRGHGWCSHGFTAGR